MKQEQEFTAFVREHGSALLRTAQLLVVDGGDAEDALQVALLRMARHWPVAQPYAYVRRSLVNLAIDRARRRHLVAVPSGAEPALVVGDLADAVVAQARLESLLALLPPRQRAAVVLRVVEGLSEAATAMGCAPGTVKSNLSRGLARLRELVPEEVVP